MKSKTIPRFDLIIIILSIVIFIFFLPYYPKKFRYFFLISLCIWIFFLLRNQNIIYFFIPWIFINLGNHPGGRFLEVGIYFITIVAFYNLIQNFYNILYFKELIKIFLLLWIPIITNVLLFLDWEHYYVSFFNILSSSELEPFYPIKQLIITFKFSIVIINILSNKKYYKLFRIGFLTSFVFLVIIGFLEYFLISVQNILDTFQIWISGYTDRLSPNHFMKLGFNSSIKSLFWNRSWLAMYFITSLPIIVHFSMRKFNKKFYLMAFSLFVLFYLFLIGSRGALFSFLLSFIYVYISNLFIKYKNTIIVNLFLFTSLAYVFFTILPKSNYELIRREHLLSGFEAFKLSIISGWGFDSYGWVNEIYLRGMGFASYFHSTHNDYLNFLVGNGIILFIYYLWIHAKLLIKRNHFLFNVSILSMLIYKNFQEWTYIPPVYFLFLFIVLHNLRKDIKINSKYFYLISIILIIGSILRPNGFPNGYGVYKNPLDGSEKILVGKYKMFGDTELRVCKEEKTKKILTIKEIFGSDSIEDSESRKFCKND